MSFFLISGRVRLKLMVGKKKTKLRERESMRAGLMGG